MAIENRTTLDLSGLEVKAQVEIVGEFATLVLTGTDAAAEVSESVSLRLRCPALQEALIEAWQAFEAESPDAPETPASGGVEPVPLAAQAVSLPTAGSPPEESEGLPSPRTDEVEEHVTTRRSHHRAKA